MCTYIFLYYFTFKNLTIIYLFISTIAVVSLLAQLTDTLDKNVRYKQKRKY